MHTREEQWHAKREERSRDIANYYKTKRLMRMIQCELGIGNLPNVDPWSFKNGSMREMAQLLRRLLISLENDRRILGLRPDVSVSSYHWEERIMKNGRYYRGDVPNMKREIMSVERAAEVIDEMIAKEPDDEFTFPKFYRELVIEKGIDLIFGSATFMSNPSKTAPIKYTGPLRVVAAREIKAGWIEEENIRAFKVVVLPEDDRKKIYNCAVGYAAKSTITDEIRVAYGKDIASAVSLCKRRVKAEVMKQMGV